MKFNSEKYNEHVDYCEYVYNYMSQRNIYEITDEDIQNITDLYVDALYTKGFDVNEGVIKNDHLLHNEIKFYLKYQKANEFNLYDEDALKLRDRMERDFFSKNGHGYSESYDDEAIEDLQESFYENTKLGR